MGKRFKVGVPTSKNLQMKKATREGKCTTDTPFIIYGSTATRIKITPLPLPLPGKVPLDDSSYMMMLIAMRLPPISRPFPLFLRFPSFPLSFFFLLSFFFFFLTTYALVDLMGATDLNPFLASTSQRFPHPSRLSL